MSDERRLAAWIGASVVIEGNVGSSEDLTIAGRVVGDVAARQHVVVVASGARIEGDVVARAVVVQGEVRGSVTCEQRVEVGETGAVHGDIKAPRMMVAEGAALHGRLAVGVSSSGSS